MSRVPAGGATPRRGRPPERPRLPTASSERGSLSVEAALLAPAFLALCVVVLLVGLYAAETVGAARVAGQTAGLAARAGDDQARAAALALADASVIEVVLDPPDAPPGGVVTAEVRVRSRALDLLGVELWAVGRARAVVEP